MPAGKMASTWLVNMQRFFNHYDVACNLFPFRRHYLVLKIVIFLLLSRVPTLDSFLVLVLSGI